MRTSRRLRRLAVLSALLMLLGLMAAPAEADDAVSPVEWVKVVRLSHPGMAGEQPAISGHGSYVITAWTTGSHVYARLSTDSGVTWGTRYLMGKGTAPSVTWSGTNGYVAWWYSGTVYGRQWMGTRWSSMATLSPAGQACSYPSLYSTGKYTGLFFWRCKTPPNDPWLLTHRRSANYGRDWGVYRTVHRMRYAAWVPYEAPATAAHGANVWAVTSIPNSAGVYGLYAHNSTNRGRTFNTTRIYRNRRDSVSPRVSLYGNSAHVIYRRWNDTSYTSSHVWHLKCPASSTACGSPARLTSGLHPWGTQHVAAYDAYVRVGISRNGVLWYRTSHDGGSTWTRWYRLPRQRGWGCSWRAWATVSGTQTVYHDNVTGTYRVYHTHGTWGYP